MNKQITFAHRLRYGFDNVMSRGTVALIGLLALGSGIVILVAGVLISALQITQQDGEPLSFSEAAWESLTRTLDSGTFGGDTGWVFRLVMLVVTIGGIFVVSTLIGVLSNGLEESIAKLRKGRSAVLEQNHTLILGWSPKVFTIIRQLAQANSNQKRPRIVILAEKDKVEMEDEIREKVGDTGRTQVICRTGNPIDMDDLNIVNPYASKSIIVIAPDEDEPDTAIIKTILALTNNPNRAQLTPATHPGPLHIVAEIHDAANLEVASMVGRDEAKFVLAADLISRITVQTCRQSGLSVVYSELLDFDRDEIYFQREPALDGKTFGEAIMAYEDSAIIGVRFNDGTIKLNPSMDTVLAAGDQLIAVSEDDDTVKLAVNIQPNIDTSAIRTGTAVVQAPERTLILGWNARGNSMLTELDSYVAANSQVLVVANGSSAEVDVAHFNQQPRKQTVEFRTGNITDRATLNALNLPSFNHVILMSYSDTLKPQEADAKTLITLLHLRAMSEQTGRSFNLVSEMLDGRNRDLADVTRADDFIVSDKFASLLLTQISENKELPLVYEDLFTADGSELYLKPASEYVALDQPMSFYTVMESARRRSEVAIGYRNMALANAADQNYGVEVNPKKSAPITFRTGDKVIVLAES